MSSLPDLQCSACEGTIHESLLGEKGVYASWSYTCSPECGSWMYGYAEDRDESDPRMVLWNQNREAIEAASEAVEQRKIACGERGHEWSKGKGYVRILDSILEDGLYRPAPVKFAELLECSCGCTKAGETLNEEPSLWSLQ